VHSRTEPSGYCRLHGPRILEEKRQRAEPVATKRKPLDEVLEVLTSTAAARGWSWEIDSIDEGEYRHAAVLVKRHVDDGQFGKQVTGLCEVTLNGGVKLSLQKTSFYDYGISQLHEALGGALGKLPWLKAPKKAAPQPVSPPAPVRLEPVLRRFNQVAGQPARRHDDRATLVISDEYDVQDLLHAILTGLFDDVRAEEGTPSYGGGAGRMDFCSKRKRRLLRRRWRVRNFETR
jgi:hypothetical protein